MSAAPSPLRLAALGVPRHSCNHCSACCSSFRVGPLLPEDVDRVRAALPTVQQAFPDQVIEPAFVTETHRERPAVFLAKRDGFCTFFRKGTGCVIHASAGSEEKPLVCQLFPLQLIRTEDSVRIGVRPTCLSDGRMWESGDPVPGDFISRVVAHPMGVLDRPLPVGEDVLLRVLGLPDLDTATVLSFLAQRPTREDPPDVQPWFEAGLAAVLEAVDSLLAMPPEAIPGGSLGPLHPGTSTAGWLARFRRWMDSRPHGAEARWPEVPPELLPYVRDALRRLVYVGQTSLFPTLPWAMLAYLAAARWSAAFAAGASAAHIESEPSLCAPGTTGEPLLDRFGPMFSSWLILLEGPRLQRALVQGGPPFA